MFRGVYYPSSVPFAKKGGFSFHSKAKYLMDPYIYTPDVVNAVTHHIENNYHCFKVSWMRNYDGYPLFIGHEKYINDQRFELVSRR